MSDQAFDALVTEIASPLFPEGLTTIDAYGRYELTDGTRIDETGKVLILVYPDERGSNEKISAIITRYRARFEQESVGWVRTVALACF